VVSEATAAWAGGGHEVWGQVVGRNQDTCCYDVLGLVIWISEVAGTSCICDTLLFLTEDAQQLVCH
jgi:hypothetical protein